MNNDTNSFILSEQKFLYINKYWYKKYKDIINKMSQLKIFQDDINNDENMKKIRVIKKWKKYEKKLLVKMVKLSK